MYQFSVRTGDRKIKDIPEISSDTMSKAVGEIDRLYGGNLMRGNGQVRVYPLENGTVAKYQTVYGGNPKVLRFAAHDEKSLRDTLRNLGLEGVFEENAQRDDLVEA